MVASLCSGPCQYFLSAFRGFTLWRKLLGPTEKGLQKRKPLGRDSITLPTLIKDRELQLHLPTPPPPTHTSPFYLFMLQSILPWSKSFLPAEFPNAIALSMVHSTPFINVYSSFLSKQGEKRRKHFLSLQKGRHKVWICSRLSIFLDWKVPTNVLQTTHML